MSDELICTCGHGVESHYYKASVRGLGCHANEPKESCGCRKNPSDVIKELYDLRAAVKRFCDDLIAHDAWFWGDAAHGIMDAIDYSAPADIMTNRIIAKMTDSRHIELIRLVGGFSVGYENKVTK